MKFLRDIKERADYYFKGQGIAGTLLAIVFFACLIIAVSSPVWLFILGLFLINSFID